MKKLILSLVLLTLVACGSDKKPELTVTVCSLDEPGYSVYDSAKQTMHSKKDIVKVIEFEGLLDLKTKEVAEATLEVINESLEETKDLEGVTLSVELINDTVLRDKSRYELEVADLDVLRDLGLLEDTGEPNARLISNKKTVTSLEELGFTCK